MFITKCILKGYKRFFLNEIEYFEYTPESRMQLIVGRNGCGKTSLLEAMINQPANRSDYEKGGLNELHFNHKGYSYILINDFSSSPKYSFQKRRMNTDDDWEELNHSRLVTTQKELYLELTSINDEIASMLTGSTTFTGMSVAKKREWFNLMHTADTTYANNIFQKIKSKHNSVSGAIKELGEKVALEKTAIATPEEVEILTKEKESLEVLSKRYAIDYSSEINDLYKLGDLDNIRKELETLSTKSNKILSNDILKNYEFNFDIDDIKKKITLDNTNIIESKTALKLKLAELDDLRQSLSIYKKLLSVEELEIKINLINEKLEASKRIIITDSLKYNAYNITLDTITDIQNNIIEFIINNKLHDLYRDEAHAKFMGGRSNSDLINELENKTDRFNALKLNLKELELKIDHYNKHSGSTEDLMSCPACKYSFNPYLQDIDIKACNNIRDDLLIELDALNSFNKTLTKAIKIESDLIERKRLLQNLCYENNISEIIPSIINTNREFMLTTIRQYFNQFKERLLVNENEKELKLLNEALSLAKDSDARERERLTNKEIVILKEIDMLQEKMQYSTNSLDNNNEVLNLYGELKILSNGLDKQLSSIDMTIANEFKYIVNKKIYELWEATNHRLGVVTRKLHDIDMKISIIKEYESTIAKLTEEKTQLANLISVLNPQDGLIAEQSTTFINVFIKQLNGVIAKIFNYDLVVEPCDLEEGGLNYKFKVTGGNQIRPDVNNTSDGQKELINFAFKMLAYKHLHLDQIPFINDELGRAFDEHHKQVSVDYLKELIANDMFEQFFLISHHANSYSTLLDAEVVVLDPTNIELPKVYNTQVVIK